MNLTRADRAHLNRALKMAAVSTERQKHGALVASGRRVLSVGVNTFRSHPNTVTDPKHHASFHAEVAAIRALRTSPTAATIYVARVIKNGSPGLSRPCSACYAAIKSAGIKRVVYSADDGIGILNP